MLIDNLLGKSGVRSVCGFSPAAFLGIRLSVSPLVLVGTSARVRRHFRSAWIIKL